MKDWPRFEDIRPCGEVLTDPDGFAVRCMVVRGTEHSHHDYTARESVVMGNQVIDGRGILFDADGYPIEADEVAQEDAGTAWWWRTKRGDR